MHKLTEKYDGPLRVNHVFNNGVTYELIDETGRIIQAHHSQLRKWRNPPAYMQEFIPDFPSSDSGRACRECARLGDDGGQMEVNSKDCAGSIPVFSFGLPDLGKSMIDTNEDDSSDSDVCYEINKKSLFEFFRRSRDKNKCETSDSSINDSFLTDTKSSDSDPYLYDYTYESSDSSSDPYSYDYTYDSCES